MQEVKQTGIEFYALIRSPDYIRLAELPGTIPENISKAVEQYITAGQPEVEGFKWREGPYTELKRANFMISTSSCRDRSFWSNNNVVKIAKAVHWYLSRNRKPKYSNPGPC